MIECRKWQTQWKKKCSAGTNVIIFFPAKIALVSFLVGFDSFEESIYSMLQFLKSSNTAFICIIPEIT